MLGHRHKQYCLALHGSTVYLHVDRSKQSCPACPRFVGSKNVIAAFNDGDEVTVVTQKHKRSLAHKQLRDMDGMRRHHHVELLHFNPLRRRSHKGGVCLSETPRLGRLLAKTSL